jgi:hypothetical protein
VGWIAVGDRAYGVVLAAGGIAVGGISLGGASVGLISVGGASLGLFALGGFALGGIALGGAAIGVLATGGMAIGLIGAAGGMAVARDFALGGLALARQANDAGAREFFSHYGWMDLTRARNHWWMNLCWLPMLLVVWQGVQARRCKRNSSRS